MKEFNGIVLKMNLHGSVLKINLYRDSYHNSLEVGDAVIGTVEELEHLRTHRVHTLGYSLSVGDAGFEPASTGSKPVRISRLP